MNTLRHFTDFTFFRVGNFELKYLWRLKSYRKAIICLAQNLRVLRPSKVKDHWTPCRVGGIKKIELVRNKDHQGRWLRAFDWPLTSVVASKLSFGPPTQQMVCLVFCPWFHAWNSRHTMSEDGWGNWTGLQPPQLKAICWVGGQKLSFEARALNDRG